MPTYLACFVICDYEHYSLTMKDGKPFTLYLPKQYINQTEYPATIGKAAIEYYIDYLQVDYPLPKEGKYDSLFFW